MLPFKSILTKHSSCMYRSVHLHADLRGAGTLSVQMKHSGDASASLDMGNVCLR